MMAKPVLGQPQKRLDLLADLDFPRGDEFFNFFFH